MSKDPVEVAEGTGEEQVPAPAVAVEGETSKPSDELKVVIAIKDGRVMLGAQAPECDPFYTTLQGNLAAALKRTPKFVEEAMKKWSESPRYPDAILPEPPPPPPTSTPARTQPAPKKKPAQPSFF